MTYTKVIEAAPGTASQALRMAVQDVQAMEAMGIEYVWSDCARCTAGAVCTRLKGERIASTESEWRAYGEEWAEVLVFLSHATVGVGEESTDMWFATSWPTFWSPVPMFEFKLDSRESIGPVEWAKQMLTLANQFEEAGC